MDCGQFSEQLNRTGSLTLRAGKSPGSTPHFYVRGWDAEKWGVSCYKTTVAGN